jgi:hypothetical protein
MNEHTETGTQKSILVDPWAGGGLTVDCGEPDEVEMTSVLDFVGGTPGYHLFRDYQIGQNPEGTHWVLWESIEDEFANSAACITRVPVAASPLEMGDQRTAAKSLLLALWATHHDIGYAQPNCMDSYLPNGLLSEDEVHSMLTKIWAKSPFEDDVSEES